MFQRAARFCVMIAITVVSTLVIQSCGGEDDENGPAFNRSVLLEEMAQKLIIPNFEQLQSSVDVLSTTTAAFISNPSIENLEMLRSSWVQAVVDYQHCSAFGFGPASLPLGPFATVLGVFPVDENQVEINMGDPNFRLAATFDRDVRGFYAVEYLIYGDGQSDLEIVNGFDANRKAYLGLIVDELKATFDGIVTEWKSTYKDEFVKSDGTSAGSSISLLYNEFVKDYENLKNFKVELPAGLTAGQAGADPTLVEAYYSGISTSLIQAHFENSKNIWQGKTPNGEDFVGFEEYLESVVGGPELVSTTLSAITAIDDAIDAIPIGRFSEHVGSDEAEALRNELQSNTANFKSSMSSLLGISITFNSGDGD